MMKRTLPPVLALLLLAAVALPSLQAQTYTYTKSVGPQIYTATLRPNSVLLMKGPADDTLTAWQPLPFPWSLYGRAVTGYYASDNGYITFDSLATASVGENLAAADPAAPNDAIYAYWDDLHFSNIASQWSNEIRSITVGDAPNRAHVVAWISAVPAGREWSSADNLAFAVALKEQGGFAVVHFAGRKTLRDMTGSIGCENAGGTLAAFVDGSPALDYPELTSAADDDITYDFDYRETPLDLAAASTTLPAIVKAGVSLQLDGTVKNLGTDTISSCTVRYRVSAPGQTDVEGRVDLSGLSMASNHTASFSFPLPLTLSVPGTLYAARVWTELPNGQADGVPANDTLLANVFTITGSSAERHVLVEEFTGAWCPWCPDGGLHMQAIAAADPAATLVAIHAGGVDSMCTAAGDAVAAAYKPAYPHAMIDRVKFPGEKAVPISRTDSAWLRRTIERGAAWSPLSLDVATAWNPATRTVDITSSVTMADYAYPGELRMNVWIVEDRVTGSGTGYDQKNAYSNNSSYPNHPYFGQPNPMTNFPHRHVLRASLTGAWGEAGVLPFAPQRDSSYTHHASAVLPTWVDEHDVSIVAFVSYDTAAQVLNSRAVSLLGTNDVAAPPSTADAGISIAPHPVSRGGIIRCNAASGDELRIAIVDRLGRIRREWSQPSGGAIPFNAAELEDGLYFVRISSGAASYARSFVVLHR